MLKTYKIENFPNFWSCTVNVDPDNILEEFSQPESPYTTSMVMKEMILYWHEGDVRLEQNDNDITKTFLQQLAREIFIILAEQNLNLQGVLNEFKKREGWHLMDGTVGIEIIEIESLEFDHDDFEVEEV